MCHPRMAGCAVAVQTNQNKNVIAILIKMDYTVRVK